MKAKIKEKCYEPTKWDSKRIKTLRAKYNLTQEKLASIVGVKQPSLARMESGKRDIMRLTWIALDLAEAKIKEMKHDSISGS